MSSKSFIKKIPLRSVYGTWINSFLKQDVFVKHECPSGNKVQMHAKYEVSIFYSSKVIVFWPQTHTHRETNTTPFH